MIQPPYGPATELTAVHEDWMRRDAASVLGWRYQPSVIFERGQGLVLTDVDGRRYYDCTSGMMSLPLGHSHPELVDAAREQAGRFTHHSSWYGNVQIVELAERVRSSLPVEFGPINFAVTGSEANEVALRMARAVTGRSEFVSALRGLHGGTLAMETLTNVGGPRKRKLGPLMTPTRGLYIDVPFEYRTNVPGLPDEAAWVGEHLRRTREHLELVSTDDVAAILLETIPVAGGFIVPPPSWLHGIRKLADDIGALLILDEAQLAPARTGTMWCFEQAGIVPDIVTFAKGMGAGLPVCGAVASREVVERSVGLAGIPWGGTFTGDPLAAAVADRQLEIIERDGYVARAERLGRHFGRGLDTMQQRTASVVGDVRGRGLYHVLDIVGDPATRTPDPGAAERIRLAALELGLVLIVVKNYVRLCPSLVATEAELDDIVDRLTTAIERVVDGHQPAPAGVGRTSYVGL